MTHPALDGVDGHCPSPLTENLAKHQALDAIVERSGRAVRAHEIQRPGRDARLGHRLTNGEHETASPRIRRRDVDSVARARVTEQAAETARGFALARHQHERRRLPEEKAGASAIERSDALARERSERVEAAHHEAAQDV